MVECVLYGRQELPHVISVIGWSMSASTLVDTAPEQQAIRDGLFRANCAERHSSHSG
jgi:hypothetical protein